MFLCPYVRMACLKLRLKNVNRSGALPAAVAFLSVIDSRKFVSYASFMRFIHVP